MKDKPDCPQHGVRFMKRIAGNGIQYHERYRCQLPNCTYEVKIEK